MLTCSRAYDTSYFEDYYALKSDPNSIKWSGYENAPDYNLLKKHYNDLIVSERVILFFSVDNEVVGYSQISFHDKTAEVDGYSVISGYSGKGLGTQIIKTTMHYVQSYYREKLPRGGNCLGVRE